MVSILHSQLLGVVNDFTEFLNFGEQIDPFFLQSLQQGSP